MRSGTPRNNASARRDAAAYAAAIMGAVAATGNKYRPRGMGGSGLPFARHEGLPGRPFAEPLGQFDAIARGNQGMFRKRNAVSVGPHAFSKKNVTAMLASRPRALNPLTRRPLPNHVYDRYGPPTTNASANANRNREVAEMRRVLTTLLGPSSSRNAPTRSMTRSVTRQITPTRRHARRLGT